MNFADRVHERIAGTHSVLVAGFDPEISAIPRCFLEETADRASSIEEGVFHLLAEFYEFSLVVLKKHIAAIKPNIAFFEQYGVGGIRAFERVCRFAQELDIPVIADAKRGDIGTTATAYARAFLGTTTTPWGSLRALPSDALTVNPYLGFDTIEPFLQSLSAEGRGLFVLVRTSNPGAATVQEIGASRSVSDTVAEWVTAQGEALVGRSGISPLGAVVGATDQATLERYRALMPKALFLIPGMGAQGGTATDAAAGFLGPRRGALVNVSRGLMSSFSSLDIPKDKVREELLARVSSFNRALDEAFQKRFIT